jgi:hypothetical protein
VGYLALWLSAIGKMAILFCTCMDYSVERTTMKIMDRLLEVFGRRRSALLGAATQPNDLMAYIHLVRANAYYRITGKKLPIQNPPTDESAEDIMKNLSPSRRLARRDL